MKTFEEVLADAKKSIHSVDSRLAYRHFCMRATGIVREWMWENLAVARYTVAVHVTAVKHVAKLRDLDNVSLSVVEKELCRDMAMQPKRVTAYALNGRGLCGPKRPVATAIAFFGPDGTTYVGGASVDKHDQWDRVLGRWQAISTAKALTAEEVERVHTLRWGDPLFDPGNRRPLDVAVLSPYHEWVAELPSRARSASIYCADMAQRVRNTRHHIRLLKERTASNAEAAAGVAASSSNEPEVSA